MFMRDEKLGYISFKDEVFEEKNKRNKEMVQ